MYVLVYECTIKMGFIPYNAQTLYLNEVRKMLFIYIIYKSMHTISVLEGGDEWRVTTQESSVAKCSNQKQLLLRWNNAFQI